MGEEAEVVEREVTRGSCRGEHSKASREESKDTTVDRVVVPHIIQPDRVVKMPERGIVEHALPLQVLPTTQIIPRIRVQKGGESIATQVGANEMRTGVSVSEHGAKASLWTRIKKILHWNGKNRS